MTWSQVWRPVLPLGVSPAPAVQRGEGTRRGTGPRGPGRRALAAPGTRARPGLSAGPAGGAVRRRPQAVRPAPAKNVSCSPGSCKSIWPSSLVGGSGRPLCRDRRDVSGFPGGELSRSGVHFVLAVRVCLLVRQTAFCGSSGNSYPGPGCGTSPSLPRPQSRHQQMLSARAPAPPGPARARSSACRGRRSSGRLAFLGTTSFTS